MAVRLSRRLFVSNLPWTVGQREFFEYFVQFGPIVSHNVIFDKSTGLSKKYGFIQFGSPDGNREVFKQKTHYLEGNILRITESDNNNNNNNNDLQRRNENNWSHS